MRKLLLSLVIAPLLMLSTTSIAQALIIVPSYGETGWQTYTNTFEEAWTGMVGLAVSNEGDTGLDSYLLIDNLNFGPAGNEGFEMGDFTGFSPFGTVSLVSSFNSYFGNSYTPTQGDWMALLQSNNEDTSFIGGTNGSILALSDEVSFDPGQTVSFDWAFLAYDYYPFEDFAILLPVGEFSETELLAKIGPGGGGIIPEPATMSLLGFGLLGLFGLRKKRG